MVEAQKRKTKRATVMVLVDFFVSNLFRNKFSIMSPEEEDGKILIEKKVNFNQGTFFHCCVLWQNEGFRSVVDFNEGFEVLKKRKRYQVKYANYYEANNKKKEGKKKITFIEKRLSSNRENL